MTGCSTCDGSGQIFEPECSQCGNEYLGPCPECGETAEARQRRRCLAWVRWVGAQVAPHRLFPSEVVASIAEGIESGQWHLATMARARRYAHRLSARAVLLCAASRRP